MSNRMNYQGGSILSFAVVGVVLAVLLVGGLYWLQNYSNGLENTDQELASDTKKDTNTSDDTPKKDTKPSTTDKDTPSSSDEKTPDSTPSTDTQSSDDIDNDSTASDDAEVAELPQTGPADISLELVGLCALTFATAAYLRSRNAL